MKKMYLFLLLGLMTSASSMAQTQGGPDAYGYIWRTEAHPDGPTFAWRDITTIGTPVTGLGDDNVVGPFPMGFTFRYYWTNINQFWIGSNGYVAFQAGNPISSTGIGFPNMPTASAPNNFVAPMLSDLRFDQDLGGAPNPSMAYIWSNNVDTTIVSFHDVAWWQHENNDPNGWGGSNTFQVIFAGTDSSVTFQYLSQSGSWDPTYDNAQNPNVVGIENITGTIGLQVSNNTKPLPNTAIKFYYPTGTTYSVTDAAVTWVQNEENRGFFGVRGVPMDISTAIMNSGNTTIPGPINVTTTIRKATIVGSPTGGAAAFTGTAPVNNLAPEQEAVINYPDQFTPGPLPAGNPNPSFIVQTNLTLTGDMNPGNNVLRNELVVIDTIGTSGQAVLTYDDNDQTPGALFGFEGGANYFKPPFYPIEVRTLEYFLLTPQGVTLPTSGYTGKLWADDGVGGNPGTLLFQQQMLPGDVVANSYNNVISLNPPVAITSGGFYISWERNAGATNDIFLAADNTPPFSRQSYEVIAGVFGGYRSADEQDIMIRTTIGLPAPNSAPGTVAAKFNMSNIYPNPATNFANINFSLAEASEVNFQIVNITGQVVTMQSMGVLNQGDQQLQLPVHNLTSGVYFVRMTAGNDVVTKKMVITK